MFLISILFLIFNFAIPFWKKSLVFYQTILWPIVILFSEILDYSFSYYCLIVILLYFTIATLVRLSLYKYYYRFNQETLNIDYFKKSRYFLTILLLILFPFYLISKLSIFEISITSFFNDFTQSLVLFRLDSINNSTYGSTFNFWDNLVILSGFNLLLSLNDSKVSIVITSVFINILYTSLLGSKMGLVVSLLLLAYYYLKKGSHFKFLLIIFGTIAIFTLTLLIINFNSVDSNLSDLFITVKSYFLGGPLAFNEILNKKVQLGNSQVVWRPFIELARSLGMDFKVDSKHLFYVEIKDISTNVYSFFVSFYFQFGPILSFIFLSIYLFSLEIISIYSNKNIFLKLIFPSLLIGALFSIHAEQILSGVSGYVKFLIIYLIAKFYDKSSSYNRR
jgi:hypothetical protein